MSASGNSPTTSQHRPQLLAEWGRTGFRANLANYPHFVDARSGDIVITEHDSHRMQFFDKYTHPCRFNPFGQKGTGTNEFQYPAGVISTNIPRSQFIVADTGNKRVCSVGINTTPHGYAALSFTRTFGQQVFEEPLGLDLDKARALLYVADFGKSRVTIHDLRRGDVVAVCSPNACLRGPVDVAISPKSQAYVTDALEHKIAVFDINGKFLFSFGHGILNKPWGVCFDDDGHLLVADEGNDRVLLFDMAGQLLREVVTNVPVPKGVSVSIHGNLVLTTSDPYSFLKVIQYKERPDGCSADRCA